MKKRVFLLILSIVLPVSLVFSQSIENIAPGIWKIVFGAPEKYLPTDFKEPPLSEPLKTLGHVDRPPFDLKTIQFRKAAGGIIAQLPVDTAERFYGFGLQTNAFEQRGMRREIRISSWVSGNLGFGHASMPFYISSRGYGVLVNTARNTVFYMASKGKLDTARFERANNDSQKIALTTVDLYGKQHTPSNEVSIVVNGTEGMVLYVFGGPSMREVVQRYNLFSGGGAMPPLWGLGFKYRTKATFTDKQVAAIANYFRDNKIPCDMIGLEPGWQTHSYSCSFAWNKKNFPDPDAFISSINAKQFKLNLWEHAYTHPSSPLFDSIVKYSCDYTVWTGAVPDFITAGAQNLFGNYHETTFVKKGITAFKLDESDAADYLVADLEWSFPDIARFPSGIDGIQMRQLFGTLYNKTMIDLYRKNNKRTWFDVRSSYLFAAPSPAVLYSDMYSHADFVRMTVNSGFAGVNWSPELRETNNEADLIRRLQTITLSAQMVVNGWYLDLPPWLQYEVNKNARQELLPNHKQLEEKARKLINLRMSLLPYLYSAFARYYFEGIPPVRALVLDYADDVNVMKIDDQYMLGESILCAPFIDSASTRTVYFPKGTWYDFNTNKKYEGGRSYKITMSIDEIPMFIKDNTILPLANPEQFITSETVLQVTCHIYGKPVQPLQLFEDNSFNYDYTKGIYNRLQLSWDGRKGSVTRKGNYKGRLYNINKWQVVAS
ncbi:glycoside hydrolase family 31 protein [Longitalea luteola]|uniref:glycoside hydrolase family 31 protein n=1 Tax=Longitalea luteola TaxID=2812563 RepID=UPI001A960DDA|nr:TIM-barrel domain-containing protein [Longitalea luteola]